MSDSFSLTNAPAFCERSDRLRFIIRDVIDLLGGDVAGYQGPGVQVTLPADRGARLTLIQFMRHMGAEIRGGSRYMFPACNGEPEGQLRWKNEADRGNRSAASVEFATFDFNGATRYDL